MACCKPRRAAHDTSVAYCELDTALNTPVTLVVFDLDGTLTRTFAVDGDCYLQAFDKSLGVKDVNDKWSEYEHVTDLGVMQEV